MSAEAEKYTILEELIEVEKDLSKEVSKDLRDKDVEKFRTLADGDGTVNMNGMWKLKNKILEAIQK